jgi:hypothetical protein
MASLGLAFAAALAAASTPALGHGRSVATSLDASAPAPAPPSVPAKSKPTPRPDNSCCADPFTTADGRGERPLTITVESGLSVGRLGLTGRQDGNADIDPQTGAKKVGARMVDLGGLSFQGKATISGQPLRPVRIELPQTVVLYSSTGAEAELSDIRTDLPGVAMLDASGQLQFSFGATISSKDGQGGDFRGRIPIRVEYF